VGTIVSVVYTQTDITHSAAVNLMHVRCRALCRLVLTRLAVSAPGVLLDADHWYSVVKGWENARWLHYSLVSAPAVLVLLSILWGLVATAFTLGWGAVEPAPIVDAPVIELPQLNIETRALDTAIALRDSSE
jgi:hypothetical protein